jgi:hypothetical protein
MTTTVEVLKSDVEAIADILEEYVDCPDVWAPTITRLRAALSPRSEGTTPAPATLDEDYAYEHARRLCDELRPIIEGDDLTRAVIRRYLTSAIVHGMQLHAQVTSSPGAVPEARPPMVLHDPTVTWWRAAVVAC